MSLYEILFVASVAPLALPSTLRVMAGAVRAFKQELRELRDAVAEFKSAIKNA